MDVVSVGFFGKLPSLGDFVGRDVEPGTMETWDRWLQVAMSASREVLGERWLDLYLTAPIWRFFAHAGVLEELPVAGVLFPSVDRVGRNFPFTVFARLPARAAGLVVADRCAGWFDRVEDLLLAHLDGENNTVERLDGAVAATADLLAAALDTLPIHPPTASYRDPRESRGSCIHLPLGDRANVAPAALAWLEQLIDQAVPGAVFWWSSGSNSVRPSWLITKGLPDPHAFAAMLSGAWGDWPWESGDALQPITKAGPPGMRLESSAATHMGRVRTENQDAFISRPDIGLWAVADGMGGHSAGQLASRAAADALARLEPRESLPDFVSAIRDTLTDVNGYLHTLSLRSVTPTVIGTTVVALVVRGGNGVCVWAGDSRLYRLRGAAFDQLTVDHSEVLETDDVVRGAAASSVITRALGGHEEIELDQTSFDVQPGDHYLLCSDGLYRELAAGDVVELLRLHGTVPVADALVERVLVGEAADNVTAVVVCARPGAS